MRNVRGRAGRMRSPHSTTMWGVWSLETGVNALSVVEFVTYGITINNLWNNVLCLELSVRLCVQLISGGDTDETHYDPQKCF